MSTFNSTNAGIFLTNAAENPVTIASGAYVTNTTTVFSGDAFYGNSAADWTLSNYGTINATQQNANGVLFADGGLIDNRGLIASTSALNAIDVHGTVGTVVNYGTIAGNTAGTIAVGVHLAFGGLLVNGPSGSNTAFITATRSGVYMGGNDGTAYPGATGTVVNYGTIQSTGKYNAIGFASGGTVINDGLLVGYNTVVIKGAAGTVTNFGTIISNSTADQAVKLEAGGLVTNNGTIGSTGSRGVYVTDGGTITNAGLIFSSNTAHAAISFHNVAGTVGNSATITSTGNQGVYFEDGGSVVNSAVGALIAGGNDGVEVLGAAGTVTNSGTIAHTGAGTGGQAIYLGAGGYVLNLGLLSGGRPGTTASGYPGVIEAHSQSATVINLGTITNPNDGNGVNLLEGGLLINGSGTVAALAGPPVLIYGPHQGVYMGGTLGVPTAGAIGTVINYGTIANGTTLAAAVQLVSGGTAINHGLIASARTGISFKDAAGTIDNFGMIVSTAPTTYSHGAGAYLGAGGLITNALDGTITAQRAGVSIAFNTTTTAVATVANYGLITGAIGIAIGAGDSGSNTLINAGTIVGTSGVAIELGSGVETLIEEAGAQVTGGLENFQPGDTVDLAGLPFGANGTVNLKPNDKLSIDENGSILNITLVNPTIAGDVFTLSNDGSGGTLLSEAPGAAPYAITDPLMTNTSGELAFDEVVGGQIAFGIPGGLGAEWEFDGAGFFLNNGNGNPGFLIRDTGNVNPGALYVGEVVNGSAAYTEIGGLGLEWQFEGNADFFGTGQSEFLIRNTGTVEPGTLDLGQVVSTVAGVSVNYTQIGGLGLEWEFDGTGDFLGDGNQGFLIRNTGSTEPGVVDVGEVVNGAVQYTQVGGVGTEWDFEGTGDFLGDGHTGFLLWNSGSGEPGAMAIGEVINGQLSFTDIGGVGPEWQFVGTGNYIDSNKTDFLLRNTGNGALVVASVAGTTGNATVNFTTVGGVGGEWTFHNTSAALLA